MSEQGLDRLIGTIEEYTLSPFSGSKGPRRDLIERDLESIGLFPLIDENGNLWAKKGDGEKTTLISSHMDTVFGLKQKKQKIKITSHEVKGTIDNSIGCALNIEMARRLEPDQTTLFLFTVEEEDGNHGAETALKTLENGLFGKKEIKPDLCIVLDVTNGNLGNEKNFSVVENFSSYQLKQYVDETIKKWKFDGVKVDYHGVGDETYVYKDKLNCFALGPVVYGFFHTKNCYTSLTNLDVTLKVLEKMLTDKEFMKELPKFSGQYAYKGVYVWRGHPSWQEGWYDQQGDGKEQPVQPISQPLSPERIPSDSTIPIHSYLASANNLVRRRYNSGRNSADKRIIFESLDEIMISVEDAAISVNSGNYVQAWGALDAIQHHLNKIKWQMCPGGDRR